MSKFIKFGVQEVQFFLIFQNVLELNNYYVHNNKLTSSERKQLLLHRSGTETIIDLSMPTALDCKVKSLIKQQQKQKKKTKNDTLQIKSWRIHDVTINVYNITLYKVS